MRDLVQEIDLHDLGSWLVRTEIHKAHQFFFTKCGNLFWPLIMSAFIFPLGLTSDRFLLHYRPLSSFFIKALILGSLILSLFL